MRLKSLELHGFKSFPNKTVIRFDEGATVIVGPNGSGKSNIADAMRWVLGEISSKTLRGSKMEDVIFGGTARRNPLGFCQVTLVMEEYEKLPIEAQDAMDATKLLAAEQVVLRLRAAKTPYTGDETPIALLTVMLILSAGAVVTLVVVGKKKKTVK